MGAADWWYGLAGAAPGGRDRHGSATPGPGWTGSERRGRLGRMKVLNTPEERFAELPDFPYQPRYVPVEDGLSMAYVEAEIGRAHV